MKSIHWQIGDDRKQSTTVKPLLLAHTPSFGLSSLQRQISLSTPRSPLQPLATLGTLQTRLLARCRPGAGPYRGLHIHIVDATTHRSCLDIQSTPTPHPSIQRRVILDFVQPSDPSRPQDLQEYSQPPTSRRVTSSPRPIAASIYTVSEGLATVLVLDKWSGNTSNLVSAHTYTYTSTSKLQLAITNHLAPLSLAPPQTFSSWVCQSAIH